MSDENTKQITIYDKDDYERDNKSFNNSINNGTPIDFNSFKRLMVHDLCTNSEILYDKCVGGITLDKIEFALEHPTNKMSSRVLIDASTQLMRLSPHYYRLNSLYSNMALFCWWLDLYGVKENANISTIKREYSKLAEKLENMNIKHEFSKIMKYLPFQDIYCGLVVEDSTDFFFQRIEPEICKLFQIQDGLYNFKINLAQINPKDFSAYPDYVQEEYIKFIDGESSSKWFAPPPDKQICIKMNSQWTFSYPMMIGLVKDILDLKVYKQLKLQSARTDNYKAIMVEVPIDKDSVDKPLLTPETLGVFAEINRENLTDDIGMIHTLGAHGEAISFKDSTNTKNNVSDAINEIYNSSGESKELFNGSSSSTALTFSVENDSGFIYSVYRQFERWVNRYIKTRKYNKTTFKFSFSLLDVTIFNRENVTKRYKEAVSLGVTCIDKWLASLDMTPSKTLGSYIVHNDIFDFHNNFVPLVSSYNESATSNEPGRPTNASKGELLDVEGEKTADGDKNDR